MKIKPHQQTDSDGTPRVHPNTHCPDIGKLKGLQWVGANAREEHNPLRTLTNNVFEHMGLSITPC